MSASLIRSALLLTCLIPLAGCEGESADSTLDPPTRLDVADPLDGVEPRALPPLTVAEVPPPPIGASALAVDGDRAVISDSDRRRIVLVDLPDRRVVAEIDTAAATPGRIALRGDRAFVVLRDAGEVAAIDLEGARLAARYPVCPAPRGVAADDGALYITCLGGRLLRLDPDGGRVIGERWLAPDLRDVVIDARDGGLWISRFRAAELLYLADFDAEPRRFEPSDRMISRRSFDGTLRPNSAWRLRAAPDGGALMLHVFATGAPVDTRLPGGYGGGDCGPGLVTTALTRVEGSGENRFVITEATPRAVTAVDMALTISGGKDGGRALEGATRVDVVAPGNRTLRPTAIRYAVHRPEIDRCGEVVGWAAVEDDALDLVAADGDGRGETWFFSREPAALVHGDGARIDLGGGSVFDSGHDLFHVDGGGGIACASCHPEGGDDGHVWRFSDLGPRRTQELRGGIKGTEPFHWAGDLADFSTLADEVFGRRMRGPSVSPALAAAWLDWIDSVPLPRADLGADPVAAERGRALYADPLVGCAGCHGGARLADGGAHDVGTGGPLETPTLRGIALRGPFMHDGCAPDLTARFTDCGGSAHGEIEHLTAEAVGDLVEFLRTL